ncbi:uncharacterized protein LOC121739843 [Aricia agestis]|uniref:uncharacterized protein LOC121739843 n=1 Tax=Aricia agestis TaxID=91739 RepID=UPI001C201F1F|nr:uncharacterized protein LOC121739843 [Aricia agestis]
MRCHRRREHRQCERTPHRLANMLAKLLTTLCLVALAAGVDELPYPILHTMGIYPSQHITVSSRLSSPDVVLFDGPHYYMPQCLGVLDATHLCGLEGITGIEVKISDPSDFAQVKIDIKNNRVSFRRRGEHDVNCKGVALVDLRLSCDHYKFSNSRNRLRLPGLLASDEDVEAAEEDQDAV